MLGYLWDPWLFMGSHPFPLWECIYDSIMHLYNQWRNRWGGGGVLPETSDREISSDLLPGKKRQGKRENVGEKKENQKREGGNGRRKSYKKTTKGPFFFFFLVCLFFFAFHFSKRLKFVLGPPKWKFSTGKKHFMPGKKSGKMTLPPRKNMPVTPLSTIYMAAFRPCLSSSCTYFALRSETVSTLQSCLK